MTKDGPLVKVEGLSKSYGERRVLEDVSFTLERGEIAAITGRSGSGKTTFLNVLGGLDARYQGHVHIDGQELRSLSEQELARLRAGTIGFVFQSFHLMPHLSVVENVALPSFFIDFQGNPHERALSLLDEVGLTDFLDVPPARLSAGQKQRVAIARALFNEPKLLLCDEPTGNLDSHTAQEIINLFNKLHEHHGVSVLIVTHDSLVYESVGRVLEMRDGRLEEVSVG